MEVQGCPPPCLAKFYPHSLPPGVDPCSWNFTATVGDEQSYSQGPQGRPHQRQGGERLTMDSRFRPCLFENLQ